MKKTLFAALAFVMMVGVAIVLPLSSAHAVEAFAIETELRQYNPDKSYGGYFLPGQRTYPNTTFLLDMEGYVVHQWENVSGTPQLLPDGNLGSIGQLMDWDGNILWSYDPKIDSKRKLTWHHDGQWIWNKKLKQYTHLMIVDAGATKADVVAAGGDPNWDYAKRIPANQSMINEILIEVNMNKEIVWEWRFFDHTVQSKNPAWPNYVSDVRLAPGRLDVHWKTDMQQAEGPEGISQHWMSANALDYNEDLDQIVVNSKAWSSFFVIDHGKTFVSTTNWAANTAAAKSSDGDFIYRFGSPSSYNQGQPPGFGTSGHNQISGIHNIQWIRPYHWTRPHLPTDKWPDPAGYTASGVSLPGAGNFLMFDNGAYKTTRTGSRILEVNPYLNAAGVNTGRYINPPEAGYTVTNDWSPQAVGQIGGQRDYISKQIVWSFAAKNVNSFNSVHLSGAERLPNGNTAICSGNQGHLFEVTPAGEVVWEYLWPGVPGYVSLTGSTVGAAALTVKTDSGNMVTQPAQLYRAYRYGTDHPGLAGRDLTRKGTITGRLPRVVGSDFTYPQPIYGFGFGNAGDAGSGGASAGSSSGTGY